MDTRGVKRSRTEGENAEQPMAAQAGQSTPGGPGSSVVANILKNPHSNEVVFKFHKSIKIYTGGYQFKGFQANQFFQTGTRGLPTHIGAADRLLITPLAMIDPNNLHWFLSPAEFAALPKWCRMVSSHVKVTPDGYKLPFQTNEANASFANSQTIVYIQTAIGLEEHYLLFNGQYTSAASDLTLVTGLVSTGTAPNIDLEGIDISQIIYGSTQESQPLGCNIGIQRHLNNYMVIVSTPDNNAGYSPNLIDNSLVQNINDCKGSPVCEIENHYENGLLKLGGANSEVYNALASGVILPLGNKSNNAHGVNQVSSLTAGSAPIQTRTAGISNSVQEGFFGYNFPIEKNVFFTRQYNQMTDSKLPVCGYFGVQPVQSNAVLAATPTFSNVSAIWTIQTECDIVCEANQFKDGYSGRKYMNSWTPFFMTNTGILNDQTIKANEPYLRADARPIYNQNIYADTYNAANQLKDNPNIIENNVQMFHKY